MSTKQPHRTLEMNFQHEKKQKTPIEIDLGCKDDEALSKTCVFTCIYLNFILTGSIFIFNFMLTYLDD